MAEEARESRVNMEMAERAAAWIAALESDAPGRRAAFAAWLKESPRHVEEALFAASVAQEFKGFDRDRKIDVRAILAGSEINIMPLEGGARPSARKSDRRRQLWVGRSLAATILMAVTLGFVVWWQSRGPGSRQIYATALGEQRAVELKDGSLVQLNTQSRIEVRFDEHRRDIKLVRGEALFKVHAEAARPFRVLADRSIIQAVGTQFNVDRRDDVTHVSVLEGRVRISTPKDPPRERSAGEGASISAAGVSAAPEKVDAARVTAWHQRRLIFQADTLADIATEFNRYNVSPRVRIEGDAIRQLRFTGVFDADDPESLGLILGRDRALVFERQGGELLIRAR